MPPSLDETLSVGWQHRNYASVKDPKHAIAQMLMDILMSSPRELVVLLDDNEMDEVWRDLGGGDGYESDRYERDEEQPDYTACSAEDCGYCGRCSY